VQPFEPANPLDRGVDLRWLHNVFMPYAIEAYWKAVVVAGPPRRSGAGSAPASHSMMGTLASWGGAPQLSASAALQGRRLPASRFHNQRSSLGGSQRHATCDSGNLRSL
jgi:hypothetical protein